MGAQASDPDAPGHDADAQPDESPVHEVTVSGFWLHRYEVTADQHQLCIDAGACEADDVARGGLNSAGHPQRKRWPVTGITWDGAARYCAWIGARLPTEAEWEFAARGAENRRFPWGDGPRCVVFRRDDPSGGRIVPSTPSTCTQEHAVPGPETRQPTPHQVFGMAGNVWEWVADAYGPYNGDAVRDPAPRTDGSFRVQRGGGWTSIDPLEFRAAARGRSPAGVQLHDVGVRCAWSGSAP